MSCSYIAALDTIRLTQVDECGVPIVGATSGYTFDCVASVAFSPVTDDQDDVIYRAANGSLCAVKRGCRSLLGYDITLTALQVSPEMIEVLTGNPVVLDSAGTVVGNDDCQIQCRAGFALEFWTELISPTCTTTGAQTYLYGLIPWITNGLIGELEIAGEAVNIEFTGSSRAGGGWGTGPYDVVSTTSPAVTPGRLLTPLGTTCHRRIQTTQVPPPAPSCAYTAVPALVP